MLFNGLKSLKIRADSKEALKELNIFISAEVQDDWAFFDFLKFLNIENFKLQKIELLNEITSLEEEDKNVK